jgi:N-methylhydantoinase A
LHVRPPARAATTAPEVHRRAWFGGDTGLVDTPVFSRAALPEDFIDGPVLIDEYDATCVVPPGATVRRDAFGNIEIRI